MGYDLTGHNPKSSIPRPVHPIRNEPQGTKMSMEEVKATGYFDKLDEWEQSTEGAYFRASFSYWSPLCYMAYVANEELNLNIDMSDWGYNDGGGTDETNCLLLANAMEEVIPHTIDFWNDIDNDQTFYFCVGSWYYIDENNNHQPLKDEQIINTLTERYALPKYIKEPIEIEGYKVIGAYYTKKSYITEFITFLRNCGGFSIY